ncbi:hypothetical protein D9M69_462760 [compost metagenome]
MVHLRGRQRRHVDGDEGVAEVAVVLAGTCGLALDEGIGHIDGVGDHGGGGIGLRRGGGQHRHAVGDAQRETAPAPAAGGDTAHGLVGVQLELAVGGQHAAVAPVEAREVGEQAHARRVAGREVQRDVAAVVDPRALDAGPVVEGDEFLRHAAGHGRHGREEQRRKSIAGVPHAPRDDAARTLAFSHRQAQLRQCAHEFVEHMAEARPGRVVRGGDGVRVAVRFGHDVDRAVVEMPAARVERRALGGHGVSPASGHGPGATGWHRR